MSVPYILLDKVRLQHRQITRLQSIDCTVQLGEKVVIYGHNGSGKSTLLKLLVGLVMPTNGKVEINGYNFAQHAALLKKQLGYLPDRSPLYPHMTAIEYLVWLGRLRRMQSMLLEGQIEFWLDKLDLTAVADRLIKQLSRGMQQRLGIIQALLHQPKYVVLDEPFSGLDDKQIQHVKNALQELPQTTIVIASPMLSELASFADSYYVMQAGKLCKERVESSEKKHIEKIKAMDQVILNIGDDEINEYAINTQRVTPQ